MHILPSYHIHFYGANSGSKRGYFITEWYNLLRKETVVFVFRNNHLSFSFNLLIISSIYITTKLRSSIVYYLSAVKFQLAITRNPNTKWPWFFHHQIYHLLFDVFLGVVNKAVVINYHWIIAFHSTPVKIIFLEKREGAFWRESICVVIFIFLWRSGKQKINVTHTSTTEQSQVNMRTEVFRIFVHNLSLNQLSAHPLMRAL